MSEPWDQDRVNFEHRRIDRELRKLLKKVKGLVGHIVIDWDAGGGHRHTLDATVGPLMGDDLEDFYRKRADFMKQAKARGIGWQEH